MTLLIVGLLIWSFAHFLPVASPSVRHGVIAKTGELHYKGVFALVIIASVVLMVLGWRSIEEPSPLYEPPSGMSFIALVLLIVGFVLMAAARIKCNFRRSIRHPELTGFTMWAVAHLLVNGDLRTTILFGGLGLWAVAMIFLSNKRDGAFVKPARQLPHNSIMAAAAGFVVFIAVALGHEYFTGVALAPSVAG